MDQNDSRPLAEIWRQAVELETAWHAFAEPETRRTFAAASTQKAISARRTMMVVDLWERLSNGDLLAFGYCVAPTVSDGPVALPADLFFYRPPIGIEHSDVIEAAGSRFERVRIAVPGAALRVTEESVPSDTKRPRAGGRKDTYVFSSQVLETLYATQSMRLLSAEKLHKHFKEEFERQFPAQLYQIPVPGIRTLRDQIARFRQERAKTCNN